MPTWPGKGACGDILCSFRGPTGKAEIFPRQRHHFRILRASAMLRISFRASRTTSRRTPRSNQRRGGSSGIRSISQASPLDRICSTLTDQIHFHRRKRAPRFRMASSTTGRFRRLHRASRVIAFLHHRAKAARLAGQQRLTGGGQRRTDTPRIFCHGN